MAATLDYVKDCTAHVQDAITLNLNIQFVVMDKPVLVMECLVVLASVRTT